MSTQDIFWNDGVKATEIAFDCAPGLASGSNWAWPVINCNNDDDRRAFLVHSHAASVQILSAFGIGHHHLSLKTPPVTTIKPVLIDSLKHEYQPPIWLDQPVLKWVSFIMDLPKFKRALIQSSLYPEREQWIKDALKRVVLSNGLSD